MNEDLLCVGTMQGIDWHFPLRFTNPGSKESASWQGLSGQKDPPLPLTPSSSLAAPRGTEDDEAGILRGQS